MSKSKYPNELDSSIEIPAVRDNIVEVGSDVLNSLRSAIFQIERTLGVNPQGAVGNSVADRLSRALDGNGNISKEALSMAGLVSGPISNSDVSSAAAISESKLNLDFPTSLIQQEVTALVREIDRYIARLNEIAAILTAHVHLDATNRHRAMAITVGEIGNGEQSIATNSMPISTAQEVFEDIYGSHINYDGSDISSLNKSHSANQVFFDRVNVSGDIQSDDTQGAIEETIGLANRQLSDHQNIFHQNGSARNIVSTSVFDIDDGRTTVEDTAASHTKYSTYDTRNISVISLDSPQEFSSYGVETSDMVRVSVSADETRDMQVSSATIVDGKVESVEVFGRLVADSFSGDMAKILKNKNQASVRTGLLLGVVQFADESSSGIIQISNPESAAIITSGCRPSEISATNRYFKLTFESGMAVTLDLYSSLDPAQTIDTIIREINEQLAEGAYSALAYRLDNEGIASEIAIVHNIPSNGITAYTLTASRVDDDGIDSIGLAHIDGIEMDSQPDNEYFIQGFAYSGLEEKINSEVPVITPLTNSIETKTADFTKEELAKHDIVNIISSAGANSYRIDSISSSKIITDPGQPKLSDLSTPQFLVYKNSISFESLNFDEVSLSPAHALVDIFMDKDRNILSKKRMVYGAPYDASARARFSISDFSGDLSGDAELSISIDPLGSSVLFSLDGGPTEELSTGSRIYKDIFSGTSNLKIRLYIDDVSGLYSYIDSLTDDSTLVSIVGTGGVNTEENLFLGRLLVESGNGRITGAGSTTPRVFSHVEYGLVGAKDLGSSAISKVLETPISEMRSNGVIRGIELSTAASGAIEGGKYVIDISSGVCYVKGTRFEILEKISLKTEIENSGALGGDKIFVAINEWGEVVFALADAITCASPFDSGEFCALGSIEWSDPDATAYDLRLFINDLDLKLLNSITVSPQPGMGHFSSINKAIKYAKRFSDLFPFAGVPTVHLKSGTHRVEVIADGALVDATHSDLMMRAYDDGIFLNFPIRIIGEGESTVIDVASIYTDTVGGFFGAGAHKALLPGSEHNRGFYVAGPGAMAPAGFSENSQSGKIELKDFKLKLTTIWVVDPVVQNDDEHKLNWQLSIKNIIFDSSDGVYSGTSFSGVHLLENRSEPGESVGNIDISECSFLMSQIQMGGWNSDDFKNVIIKDNLMRGKGGTTGGSEGMDFIGSTGTGSIFSLLDTPAVNNVEIIGNINCDFDKDSAVANRIVLGEHWGDRLSANLTIGSTLKVHGQGLAGLTGDLLTLTSDHSAFIKIDADTENSGDHENYNAGILMSQDDGAITAQVRLVGEAESVYDNSIANALCINSGFGGVQIGTEEEMTLTVRDGKVGINNNDPGYNLDVAGIARIFGEAYIDGILDVSGPSTLEDLTLSGGLTLSGDLTLLGDLTNSLTGENIVDTIHADAVAGDFEVNKLLHGDGALAVSGSTSAEVEFKTGTGPLTKWSIRTRSSTNRLYISDEMIPREVVVISPNSGGIGIYTDNHPYGVLLKQQGDSWKYGYSVVDNNSDVMWCMGIANSLTDDHETSDSGKLCFARGDVGGTTVLYGFINPTTGGSEKMNFTGQHRTLFDDQSGFKNIEEYVGLIVVSLGAYIDKSIKINESLPFVKLSSGRMQKSVFGVISNAEDPNNEYKEFTSGNFVSTYRKAPGYENKIILNSLGEGAMWVCNINGNLENGDYITSCEVPGHGMAQDDDLLHNYTVAKITQDCNFALDGNSYECIEFDYNGKTYRKAFVGCTYHCG